MILSKTPFRMSFVGGGSDMASFYREELGAVLSTSVDKYMYIAVNKKFDGNIRVSYSRTEEVHLVDELDHPLVRESLKLAGVGGGIEIASLADIPSRGTGLGSSSTYTVGLLNALYSYQGRDISKHQLAEQACFIEINRCGEPIGKQDQYAASFGGLNLISFNPNESVVVDPVICSQQTINKLEDNILTFFTGRTRSASPILKNQSIALLQKRHKLIMRRMVQLAFELKYELERGCLDNFGQILDENWSLKKGLSEGISDSQIDAWYAAGMKSGARGGKLLGAGNGGFLMFYAPPESHEKIKATLSDLKPIKFRFDRNGAQIIFCSLNHEEVK